MIETAVSLADIYKARKDCDSYVLDSNEKHIRTSTKIRFNKSDLKAVITHNGYKPSESIIVPELNSRQINRLLNEKDLDYIDAGLFIKELFKTEDKLEEIVETLESLSAVRRDEIRISTPHKDYRKFDSERRVDLFINEEMFLIFADAFPWKPKYF